MVKKRQQSIPLKNVSVKDSFWSPFQDLVVDEVIPYQADIFEDKVPGVEKNHSITNMRIAAGEIEGEFYGMVFQDSDVAKWLEAVAYAIGTRNDPTLTEKADQLIDLIGRVQQEDGYLNTFFIVKEPNRKWQNLQDCHELYCSGHMMEAAVAHYEATGKETFLNIMRKNADLICSRFGEGKVRGIPGHQEIELAMLRLYRVTNDIKYLEMAKYFLNERGIEPDYFIEEKKGQDWSYFKMDAENREYAQNHLPVREQTKAVGHSVRAVYMYTAMADLAAEIGDEELFSACKTLWKNIVEARMYITGGIGSTVHGEAFSADYELPNDLVYAETCASIAMIFFARRMLEADPNGEYADIMEKELYNGALSGMQLDGKRFFYVNPLEVVPDVSGALHEYKHVLPKRPPWYRCACCPPNVARLIMSLGQYAWGENESTIFSHTYLGGTAAFACAGGVKVDCASAYPYKGNVSYTFHPSQGDTVFTFALHIPAWCKDYSVLINNEKQAFELQNGYIYINRSWSDGDTLSLSLTLAPRRVYANTKVRADAGCIAILRGPLVYCFEDCDNSGGNLSELRIPKTSSLSEKEVHDDIIGTYTAIAVQGERIVSACDCLYSENPPQSFPATLTALPYFAWGNRDSGNGGMRVWIRE